MMTRQGTAALYRAYKKHLYVVLPYLMLSLVFGHGLMMDGDQ